VSRLTNIIKQRKKKKKKKVTEKYTLTTDKNKRWRSRMILRIIQEVILIYMGIDRLERI